MKFAAFVAATIMAATAYSAALPNPEPVADAEAGNRFWRVAKAGPHCRFPGQPCAKKRDAPADDNIEKREAEAIAEAIAHCRFPGQPCSKEKRDLVEREAEAVAEAIAHCRFPGQPCSKEKREFFARHANDVLEALN